MKTSSSPETESLRSDAETTSVSTTLFKLEEELTLLRHRLDGWCIWPLFRFSLGYALGVGGSPPAGNMPACTRWTLAKLAARDCFRLLNVKHRTSGPIIATHSSHRTEVDPQGRPKDSLFDAYCERLPDVVKVERINNPALFTLGGTSAHPSLLSDAAHQIVGGLMVSRLPIPKAILAVAHDLITDLHTQSAWRTITVQGICHALIRFQRLRRLWKVIFKRLGGAVLIMDDGYFHHEMIAAAKECGLKVVDLQHGAFFANGPEYVWADHSAIWHSMMPVPDELWLFGSHWRELLSGRFWADRCRVIGNARLDQYRDLRNQARHSAHGRECLLIITSQGIAHDAMINWVKGILASAFDWPELRVILKLHPAKEGGSNNFNELPTDTRLKVCSGNELPSTFQWLVGADYHASISSTCHYEAVSLGVRTFVLPMPTHEWMEPMIRAGHAIQVGSPSEMVRLMRQLHRQPLDEQIGCHYYQPGAIENFVNALRDLEGSLS